MQLQHDGPFDGCIQAVVRQDDKHHMTGKPTALMCELVWPVVPGGVVLDLFAGSGTTGVAALMTDRRFIGVEREMAYADIARERLRVAEEKTRMLGAIAPSAIFEQMPLAAGQCVSQ